MSRYITKKKNGGLRKNKTMKGGVSFFKKLIGYGELTELNKQLDDYNNDEITVRFSIEDTINNENYKKVLVFLKEQLSNTNVKKKDVKSIIKNFKPEMKKFPMQILINGNINNSIVPQTYNFSQLYGNTRTKQKVIDYIRTLLEKNDEALYARLDLGYGKEKVNPLYTNNSNNPNKSVYSGLGPETRTSISRKSKQEPLPKNTSVIVYEPGAAGVEQVYASTSALTAQNTNEPVYAVPVKKVSKKIPGPVLETVYKNVLKTGADYRTTVNQTTEPPTYVVPTDISQEQILYDVPPQQNTSVYEIEEPKIVKPGKPSSDIERRFFENPLFKKLFEGNKLKNDVKHAINKSLIEIDSTTNKSKILLIYSLFEHTYVNQKIVQKELLKKQPIYENLQTLQTLILKQCSKFTKTLEDENAIKILTNFFKTNQITFNFEYNEYNLGDLYSLYVNNASFKKQLHELLVNAYKVVSFLTQINVRDIGDFFDIFVKELEKTSNYKFIKSFCTSYTEETIKPIIKLVSNYDNLFSNYEKQIIDKSENQIIDNSEKQIIHNNTVYNLLFTHLKSIIREHKSFPIYLYEFFYLCENNIKIQILGEIVQIYSPDEDKFSGFEPESNLGGGTRKSKSRRGKRMNHTKRKTQKHSYSKNKKNNKSQSKNKSKSRKSKTHKRKQ